MRILLDESVPGRFGLLLTGHETITVQKRGWAGIKNGRLLSLAAAEFDVLLTADKGIGYQQNLSTLPLAVVIILAKSNRMEDMAPLLPAVLKVLNHLVPCTLQKIAG